MLVNTSNHGNKIMLCLLLGGLVSLDFRLPSKLGRKVVVNCLVNHLYPHYFRCCNVMFPAVEEIGHEYNYILITCIKNH